jgi:hypothetical protein
MLPAGRLLTLSFFYDAPDIDECENGIHNCPPDFICQNTLGSFRCRPKLQCKSGFIQDALGSCIGKMRAASRGPWDWGHPYGRPLESEALIEYRPGAGKLSVKRQIANILAIVGHVVCVTVTHSAVRVLKSQPLCKQMCEAVFQ